MPTQTNDPTQTVQVNLRLSAEKKALIQAGAAAAGQSTHGFIIESALLMAEGHLSQAAKP